MIHVPVHQPDPELTNEPDQLIQRGQAEPCKIQPSRRKVVRAIHRGRLESQRVPEEREKKTAVIPERPGEDENLLFHGTKLHRWIQINGVQNPPQPCAIRARISVHYFSGFRW